MLSRKGRRLHLDDTPVGLLAGRYGTPLYAYSKKTILDNVAGMKKAFPRALVLYALKANSNRSLCRLLAREGLGADIVSGGELLRALAAGFRPERIVFAGVGKTTGEFELALRRRILSINVESLEELKALEDSARRLGRKAPVSARLNPDVDAGTHAHVTTGLPDTKFGMEEAEAFEMYARARRSPYLSIRGVHCHIGSQITSVRPYERTAKVVAGFIRRLEARGIRLELVDMGGGMGIPYEDEGRLPLGALARVYERAFSRWPDLRLCIEPGRSLVGESGILLTRVLYRKKTTKKEFVVVDAAMTDLVRPAFYGAQHPILTEREPAHGAGRRRVDVVGPVCQTGDFLARDRLLPECRQGDILAVTQAGAYGFSMSFQYNSRPRAAEILVDGASARVIRRRETPRDLTRCEI